jgi:hypothetical protein
MVFAQADTIVIKDYANIFITVDDEGGIQPVTDYSKIDKAGFFLNKVPEGTLRICNDKELYVWVDGRLILTLIGCEFVNPKLLFQHTDSDSIFFSFSAFPRFENFKCELVEFGDHLIIQDNTAKARQVRDSFNEFSIIIIVILLFCFGLFAMNFHNRLEFFISKTFSLKTFTYQFTNTSFFGRANIFMILILCLTVSFEIIYVNQKNQTDTQLLDLWGYTVLWLQISFWIVVFFLAKNVLTQTVGRLFQMTKLKEWQLFDLVNFSGYFVLILFIIILWDFIIKGQNDSWINLYFSYYFITILFLFVLWFLIKFVINSSYQKLLIISYLCATEIIPSIIIMVWLLK